MADRPVFDPSWTEAVRSDPDDTPARGSQASNAADPGHRPAAPI